MADLYCVNFAFQHLKNEFKNMNDLSCESAHAFIGAMTTLKLLFEKKLNSSNTINVSALPEEMSTSITLGTNTYTPIVVCVQQPTSEITKYRITADKAQENVKNHSVLVTIYKKIAKKSEAGLTSFIWKRATLSPEVKHLLEADKYKVTPVPGGIETGFVISW